MKRKTISIDLDGVLNLYDGNFDENYIPPMRYGAQEFLKKLYKDFDIEIYTTRNLPLVRNWLIKNCVLDYITRVTNLKSPKVSIFLDDRAINFNGDYNKAYNSIKEFLPFWKKL